jgi:hypothetical protein
MHNPGLTEILCLGIFGGGISHVYLISGIELTYKLGRKLNICSFCKSHIIIVLTDFLPYVERIGAKNAMNPMTTSINL